MLHASHVLEQWVTGACAATLRARRAILRRALVRIQDAGTAAARHEAPAQPAYMLNAGRRGMAAYERCRRELERRLATQPDARYLTEEQGTCVDAQRNTGILRMYQGVDNVIADFAYLHGTYLVLPEHISDSLIHVAHRRFGKTFTNTIHNAIVMLTNPRNIYENNMKREQGQVWLAQLTDFLMLMHDHEEFGCHIVNYAAGRYVKIIGHYPYKSGRMCTVLGGGMNAAAAQGNRGQGNDGIVNNWDEGLVYNKSLYPVITPMLLNGPDHIILSSMPPIGHTSLTLLTAAYADGQRVARVLNQRSICQECARREMRLRTEVRCPHVAVSEVHFRDKSHVERVRALLQGFDSSYEQEILSMLREDAHEPVFRPDAIDAAVGLSAPLVRDFHRAVPEIFFSIDPGSDDRGSDTAFLGVVFTPSVIAEAGGAEPDDEAAAAELAPTGCTSPFDYYATVRLLPLPPSIPSPPSLPHAGAVHRVWGVQVRVFFRAGLRPRCPGSWSGPAPALGPRGRECRPLASADSP